MKMGLIKPKVCLHFQCDIHYAFNVQIAKIHSHCKPHLQAVEEKSAGLNDIFLTSCVLQWLIVTMKSATGTKYNQFNELPANDYSPLWFTGRS